MGESVLVVAFDGLDKDLIDQYNLTHLTQTEYGTIDNHTGMKEINTDELFASFITGETWEEHGVTGIKSWDNRLLNVVDRWFPKRGVLFRIGDRGKDIVKAVLGADRSRYTRDELACETLFDQVPDSTALNVPVYNIVPGIDVFSYVLDRFGAEYAVREARKEFEQRKTEFRSVLEDDYTFLMAHFHFIDSMNHLFGHPVTDEERLRDAYEEIDEFSQEILDLVEDRFDTVIFMSDHGLPTETQHNENAFYSCNHALFPDTEPHITDFHDTILHHLDTDDTTGLDI
ncbi:MAG: alkaline phosphatase family protein [Candidatus Nanohaloarchaea archaeon]